MLLRNMCRYKTNNGRVQLYGILFKKHEYIYHIFINLTMVKFVKTVVWEGWCLFRKGGKDTVKHRTVLTMFLLRDTFSEDFRRESDPNYCCRTRKKLKALHSHHAQTALLSILRTSAYVPHFVASMLTTGLRGPLFI